MVIKNSPLTPRFGGPSIQLKTIFQKNVHPHFAWQLY